jgi:hypothetical protein
MISNWHISIDKFMTQTCTPLLVKFSCSFVVVAFLHIRLAYETG